MAWVPWHNRRSVRSFEIYLAIGCAVAVVWPALFGVRTRRGVVAVGLVALVVLQLNVEGFRWQLVLLYLVAIGMAVGDVVTVERDLPWYRRVGRGLFGLIGLGLVVAPALLLPVPQVPVPSGPLAIGTFDVTITDGDRADPDAETEEESRRPQILTGPRTIPARVWYPAEAGERSQPETWEPDMDLIGPALADRIRAPGFFFDHLGYVTTPAVTDAPVADGAFPVLVYSHGWREFKSVAIDQVLDLVSQGYVVIAPDHPGVAAVTVVDDEVVRYEPLALEDPEASAERRAEQRGQLIDTISLDLVAVLDEAADGADGVFGALAESMDLEAVGLWGHGLGGGAVVQTCLQDDRCDAVAGFDPWVESLPDEVLALTATEPMLFMRSDPWRGTMNDAVLRGMVDRSETISYWVDVLGTDTSDFTATPLFSPVASRLGLKGPIDGERVIEINHRFLSGFFDRFLLDTGSAALETAQFPEVDVEVVDNS